MLRKHILLYVGWLSHVNYKGVPLTWSRKNLCPPFHMFDGFNLLWICLGTCWTIQCRRSSSGNTSGHINSHARNGAAPIEWLFLVKFTYQSQFITSRRYTFLVPSRTKGILFFIVKGWSRNSLFKNKFLHILHMVGFVRF